MMAKQFMTKLKTNADQLEIPGKRHSGVATQSGKAREVKLDLNAQQRALKIRQKTQNHK
jgi:hypothetical protein